MEFLGRIGVEQNLLRGSPCDKAETEQSEEEEEAGSVHWFVLLEKV